MNGNIVVEIKEVTPITVAYVLGKGSFGQIPGAYGVLYGWLSGRNLVPAGPPSGVFFDNPEQMPEEECKWELRAPVAEGATETPGDGRELGVKKVPGYLAAATMYKGPYQGMASTYERLAVWVKENGYEFAGPPEEVYFSDPATTPPSEYLTEIRFPVRKA